MNNLESRFNNVLEFDSDVFVADYTNQTNSREGVRIEGTPFSDIAYFHLHNENSVPLWVVNFEDNSTFFPAKTGNC